MYCVYMLMNENGRLYIGVTTNLRKRLEYHRSSRGAKFTAYDKTFRIVFSESYGTLTDARKREIQIKNWRREKKDFLIAKFKNNQETKISK